MRNHTWYNCSNSKTGNWPDGEYLIDHADIKQNSIAIWYKNQWAAATFKTVKDAHVELTKEFNTVQKIKR